MKHPYLLPPAGIAIVMLIAAAVLFAGCTAEPEKTPVSQAAPAASLAATTAVPVSGALPFGVSLTVPAGWTRGDVMTSDNRDYGRRAVRIATFSSPVTIPGNAESVNTLDVDLDKSPGADFEAYFNDATLAVGKYYQTQLDPHSIVKSGTIQVSGYKAYQLDFQTGEVRGSYIFTATDRGMYIFSFRGINSRVPVDTLQGEMPGIISSIILTPSGA